MDKTDGFELVERFAGVTEWRQRDNGLTVLSCSTPVAPVVGFGVVYGVGSRHEATGHTGATHILEHLMFKGSRSFNRERGTEIARVLHRVGAAFNATTWLDRTNYYEVLPAEQLGLAVDIESDRMRGALVREEDLESERSVVLNELDMGENEPFELLMKSSFAHAFVEHPYHHPTIGWRGDVESVSAGVLRRFYDTYYHPDNATVIVVGDVDEATALETVGRGFGPIPPASRPLPELSMREGRQRGERRFELHRAGELGSMILTWRVPEGLHPDMPPLSVLTQVLSDGVTSRLHQRLVETNRCLGVHAYALELHDPGVFQVAASIAPGVPHLEVEDAIREEIARLRTDGPGTAEVERAKAQTRTDLAFNRESPAQIMSGLTEAIAMGDWRKFPRELELISAVTAEDLQRVALEHLDDHRLTVGWFVPEGAGGGVTTVSSPPDPQPCYLRRFAERVDLRALSGGTRLAVLGNPHAPTVTVAGTVRAGISRAPDGQWSVPGLTAAMLDRGTREHGRLDLARELEDHGLQLSCRASSNAPTTVAFSAQGLAEELPRLTRLLVEVLRFPVFPEEELAKLREKVLGALAREREDTHALAYGELTRRLYPAGHPLHRRSLGAREREVASLARESLVSFHAASYAPASMVIAVVGQVEPEEVAAGFEEALEGWSVAADTAQGWPEPEGHEPSEARIRVADRPNLDVFLGHRGRLLRGDEDYGAAVLANSCLGQSTLTSRLGVAVRDRAGLTYGIYSRFFGTLGIAGPWASYLSVSADGLERAVELCRAVIAEYVAEGPGEEELADERTAQSGAYRVGLATNAGVARELVTVLTAGQPIERLDRYPEQLLAVSRDDVMAAIRRHFEPQRLVLTAAGSL